METFSARYLKQVATVVCLALAATLFCSIKALAAHPPDLSEARVVAALQKLEQFKSSRNLADLEGAVVSLNSSWNLGALTPATFVERRRMLVAAWARVLDAIDQSYDPTFDPKREIGCPLPPREASGIQRQPCANPNDIQDPTQRATYAAQLDAFKSEIKRSNRYYQLRHIDEGAMRSIEVMLKLFNKVAPEATGNDFSALDAILYQGGVDRARRAKIDAMIYGTP